MGFKSLFPFFPRDEVAPSEPDDNPDVESRFGRNISRLQGASNILQVFKFLRADYNGKLHVTQAPTDFDNINSGTVLSIIGIVTLVPPNPDRQVIYITNNSATDVSIYITLNGTDVYLIGLLPGDIATLLGFPQQLRISSTVAGLSILYLEM